MSDSRTGALRIGEGATDAPPDETDVRERGRGGATDRRLFMQLLAFGGAPDSAVLARALEAAGIDGVLYEDLNDPAGHRAADVRARTPSVS